MYWCYHKSRGTLDPLDFIGIPRAQRTLGSSNLPKVLGTTDGFRDELLDKSPGHVIMDVLTKRTRLLENKINFDLCYCMSKK